MNLFMLLSQYCWCADDLYNNYKLKYTKQQLILK